VIIEIHISRPIITLTILAGCVALFIWITSVGTESVPTQADVLNTGGSGTVPQEEVYLAELELKQTRVQRDVLERKEQILRYQLSALEQDRKKMRANMTPQLIEEYTTTRRTLMELLRDKREAEMHIMETLRQLWDAEARGSSIGYAPDGRGTLKWPIAPKYGISAGFLDEEYEELFGMPHQAIDIPALQGTTVTAAADGIIEKIADNGYGYNYLIIRHKEMGFATLYGHMEEFIAYEGQQVEQGEPIAKSGGRPGSRGAGWLSTGPHLHFEVITGGNRIDPLSYLEDHEALES